MLSARVSSAPVSTALIVDDAPRRHHLFRQNLVGTGVKQVHVDTAADAIDYLRENAPAIIFLDYDLNEHGKTEDVAGNGLDVARYLRKNAPRLRSTRIIIHSLNPIAAPAIWYLLQSSGYRASTAPHIWKDADALAKAVADALFPQP